MALAVDLLFRRRCVEFQIAHAPQIGGASIATDGDFGTCKHTTFVVAIAQTIAATASRHWLYRSQASAAAWRVRN